MCNHCKANVEKSLSNVEGVTEVRVDLAEGTAYVKGEKIDHGKIVEAIESIGYKYIEE